MEKTWTNNNILIDGHKTHYLEAGAGNDQTIVLLHSGEFGASATLSWEYTIDALSEEYHVLAPDFLGYGDSAKVFNFEKKFEYRVEHISKWLKTLCVKSSHFIGNSMGGSMLARLASRSSPPWPLNKIVLMSGGGRPLENEAREILQTYNGTFEHMEDILSVLFHDEWWDADYVKRRVEESKKPGAWQCTAASRYRAPFEQEESRFADYNQIPYKNIDRTTLIIAGAEDPLRSPRYGQKLKQKIPDATLIEIENTAHCPHIEQAAIVNDHIMKFLSS